MSAAEKARTYSLGAVLPHVRTAANVVGNLFGVATILGWRASARDMAGHPAGRALDFMVYRDKARGDRINAYLLENADALGVQYTIWQQTYYEPGAAPDPMEDRGSDTQNHRDHVHASFTVLPGSGAVKPPTGGTGVRKGVHVDSGGPLDGWAGSLAGIGLKLLAIGAGLALVVTGVKKIATNGDEK